MKLSYHKNLRLAAVLEHLVNLMRSNRPSHLSKSVKQTSIITALLMLSLAGCTEDQAPQTLNKKLISFNESIRPILNKNCVGCHGGVTKQGGISYIFREEALARGNSGRLNIVPGDAKASEFIQRIKSNDPTRRMPYKRPALSESDIQLLENWINQGAQWEEHWAFIPPVSSKPPTIEQDKWINNPIDQFVLAKMQTKQLEPNPPATDYEWLRRVSLDLIGLPPTQTQIKTFVSNQSPDKYEKMVDTLLSSAAYGERWASVWLDIARYADSRGFERDKHRDAWPYRDWLIKAFNQNMSYDDFVIKQLAGDLLPNPSMDDIIATTFHRLTPANDEGGTDDEEYRTYAVMDRNATTWIALNGITMNCVQCHAHPYDPIHHKEYFNSLAFFNTSEDADRHDDSPTLKFAYDKNQRIPLFKWQTELANSRTSIIEQVRQWQTNEPWPQLEFAQAHIDNKAAEKALAKREWFYYDESIRQLAQACKPAHNRVSVSCDGLNEKQIAAYQNYLATQAEPSPTSDSQIIPLAIKNGQLHEPKAGIPSIASYRLTTQGEQNKTRTIAALDFSVAPLAPEVAIHTPEDGFSIEQIALEIIRKNGQKEPLNIAYFIPTSVYGFNRMLSINAEREDRNIPLDASWLTGLNANLLNTKITSTAVLDTPAILEQGDRLSITIAQLQKDNRRDGKPYYLRNLKLTVSADRPSLKIAKQLKRTKQLTTQIRSVKAARLPVMQEQLVQSRRSTRVYNRGNYADKKDTDIKPLTPAVFTSELDNRLNRANRLDLARWFFKDDQPLTARVAVNRFWAQLFGQGIVKTLGDFGSIGDTPSHPQLLDWLARYFQDEVNWDIKALLKTMVLSATYRQSAVATQQKLDADPDNTYLASGPRQRLTAEMVRDQALFSAGLLSTKQFGASVMPPQPEGVWQTVYNSQKWVEAQDEDRYRRAIYTYNKRTSPYPSFVTFDDTGHTVSAAQRFTTNTPLQALVTLNDVVYHEAAQALAKILIATAQQNGINAAINQGFIRVSSRPASDTEMRIIKESFSRSQALHQTAEHSELAAWTDVASTLLNMDTSLNR